MASPPNSPNPLSEVYALVVLIIIFCAVVGVYYLVGYEEDDVSWKVTNLSVEDAGWWASVHGTLVNTGTDDASWVEVHIWVSVGGLTYYKDIYIGDVPAGGAEDFWTLVSCDTTDSMTCGVSSVSWS